MHRLWPKPNRCTEALRYGCGTQVPKQTNTIKGPQGPYAYGAVRSALTHSKSIPVAQTPAHPSAGPSAPTCLRHITSRPVSDGKVG